MDQIFSGKVAVVTGSASGIGRATAMHMATRGASVAILDIETGPLQEAVEQLRPTGCKLLSIEVDMIDREAVTEAFTRIEHELGPIDILVNNVGQSARERMTPFRESEAETWDFVIDVSLKTALFCSRLVVNGMAERKSGRIVNLSSDGALIGGANVADYSAAKMGVVGFTRALAREMGPFGVTVNVVSPGITNTRAPQRMAGYLLAEKLETVPMGKLVEPEDIANAIGFLSSDHARFITGQNLVVNGGRIFN
ncbi:MAG: SDR family oxidoreductase [Comamonadaceae bacterium]|nr:MAG: SDR family oxidoreductase [Comamonadaceae bacterium]